MSIYDYIDDRWEELAEKMLRPGFYVATLTNALQSFRRMQIDAEWGATLDQARRISSPLLDVIPAVGTRLAAISQDGVPELPAILGKIWDDQGLAADMTAWLRANLQESPGHIELGAEKGIRIKVGSNDGTITETSDGELVVESEDAGSSITMKPGGKIIIEAGGAPTEVNGNAGKIARADLTLDELDKIKSRLNTLVSVYDSAYTKSDSSNSPQPMEVDADTDPKTTSYSSSKPETGSVYGD